jgi:hypothetical protein
MVTFPPRRKMALHHPKEVCRARPPPPPVIPEGAAWAAAIRDPPRAPAPAADPVSARHRCALHAGSMSSTWCARDDGWAGGGRRRPPSVRLEAARLVRPPPVIPEGAAWAAAIRDLLRAPHQAADPVSALHRCALHAGSMSSTWCARDDGYAGGARVLPPSSSRKAPPLGGGYPGSSANAAGARSWLSARARAFGRDDGCGRVRPIARTNNPGDCARRRSATSHPGAARGRGRRCRCAWR